MQRLRNTLLFGAIIFLASCGTNPENAGGSAIADKKAKLTELKKQHDELTGEISKLEAEIKQLDPSAKLEKAKLVSLTTITTGDFKHYIDLQGKIEAEDISYIAPSNGVGGLVKAIYIKRGDFVKKGQLILKLDDAVYLKNLQQLQTQLTYAEDLYRRQKNLWDQQIGTELQLMQSRQNVDQIKDQIATIKEQWNMTIIYADVSGIADEVNIRVGELFTGYVGQAPQIRIVNNSRLKVSAQVPENYVSRVKTGSSIIVTLPDANKSFNTTISLSGKLIDPNNRSFYIEAKLPSDETLRANQIALVRIQDYTAANAVTIPVNTLQTDEKGKFVLVAVNENGRMIARKRQVQIGEFYDDKLEIKSGLNQGDQVVTEGYQGLYDGQVITVSAG